MISRSASTNIYPPVLRWQGCFIPMARLAHCVLTHRFIFDRQTSSTTTPTIASLNRGGKAFREKEQSRKEKTKTAPEGAANVIRPCLSALQKAIDIIYQIGSRGKTIFGLVRIGPTRSAYRDQGSFSPSSEADTATALRERGLLKTARWLKPEGTQAQKD